MKLNIHIGNYKSSTTFNHHFFKQYLPVLKRLVANFVFIFILFGSIGAQATDTITKPYTFYPDTPADADQVNANFDTLYDKVNELLQVKGESTVTKPHTFTNNTISKSGDSYTDAFGEDHDYTINPPSFTDNGDGTITDNNTNLIWQKEDDNTTRNWSSAISYCEGLSLGGYSDWRLPNSKELQSIMDYGVNALSIDHTYFPNTNS